MTREKWLDIASRCEKATGPDATLLKDMLVALGWTFENIADGQYAWCDAHGGVVGNAGSIDFTASLDAITALIERELPDLGWRIAGRDEHGGRPYAQIRWPIKDQVWQQELSNAATPALALCAAFARAMADKALSRNDQEKDAG